MWAVGGVGYIVSSWTYLESGHHSKPKVALDEVCYVVRFEPSRTYLESGHPSKPKSEVGYIVSSWTCLESGHPSIPKSALGEVVEYIVSSWTYLNLGKFFSQVQCLLEIVG